MCSDTAKLTSTRPNPFEKLFQSGVSHIILDGGLATELERAGHDLNHPLWSAKLLIDNPHAIKTAHLEFFRAGL